MVVLLINIWFWILWIYVALTTFKYRWTDKIASWISKLVCAKINDEDLKPIESDNIGCSNNSTIKISKNSTVTKPDKDNSLNNASDLLELNQ